ncbi:HAD-IIIC family phosphatase [Chroococcus sp. FPU101]|uniref:HAD-IIIC family phosphatase n=1 Tax=Chroococcus sp. FPU101 TaxID=1974212 RepID=UPI001A8D3A82|nr:HAD-IIIC family phosphatase [Chroococcus sp. FPU101]GFE69986.1 FkbH like protein [Chroococcus sp. FPU101]
MSLQELLRELSEKGVQLSLENNNLRIRAAKNILSESNRLQLTEYKAEIIKLLEQESIKEKPIQPISRDLPLSVSLEQERLWLANQLVTKNVAYNLIQAIRIQGKLDISILEKSINSILQRHEILQSTFGIREGRISQIINQFFVNLVVENGQLSDLSKIVDTEAHQAFDLENKHLWRFRVLKITEEEHILIIAFHHMIGDILSTGIFIKEIANFYQHFLNGKDLVLSDLSIQYADFAAWQRQEIDTENIQQQLQYWKTELQVIPPKLTLPYDFSDLNISDVQGEHQTFTLSRELWSELKRFSQVHNVTPAIILLATFEILLYRISQQKDIIIGFPTSGRFHSQVEPLIGFFAYPLPFRINLFNHLTFQNLLEQIKNKNLEITRNDTIPFSKIIEQIKSKSGVFQVLFSTFLGKQLDPISTTELTFRLLPEASRTPTDLDLLWSLYEIEEELHGVIGYNKNLFSAETIQEFIQSYNQIIQQCLTQPELDINSFKLTERLESKVKTFHESNQNSKLVIAATFTAEPISDSINFWLKELNLSYQLEFAPYNQIFQQLLDPASSLNKNKTGINCIIIRFDDWLRFQKQSDNILQSLERNLQDFILSLQKFSQQNTLPLLACICRSSLQNLSADVLQSLENVLISELSKLNNVHLVTFSDIANLYSVEDYYNTMGDELGHIPYTIDFFTALGTTIIRKIDALKRSIYKVIALDCDDTLWHGVCGEQSVDEIIINRNCIKLQNFLIQQKNNGILLCICSKNTEEDVKKVFDQHSEMKLKWSDFVAVRINWQDKSSNLKSLAKELNLGLDSFIFIDDNPVECAEVNNHCSEVLTLQLPKNSENLEQFLKHYWIFDDDKITTEDVQRNTFYRENVQRQQVLENALTLADFINSLNLQIDISPLENEQLSRVSQLTQRTNQFNATTIRRTETEIQNLLSQGYQCLTVKVQDKFGDYGLVGVIIYSEIENTLKINTFLLSCRTLGRGVEYRMLAELGKIALNRQLECVEIVYQATAKNQPILNFLQKIGAIYQNEYIFRFPTDYARQITYQPDSELTPVATATENQTLPKISANSSLYQNIATNLTTLEQIKQAILSKSNKTQTRPNYVSPRNEIEISLARIWEDFLKVEKVGIDDNFYELGGDSILMIQIVSQAKQDGLEITPIQIFEHQTIAELATIIKYTESVIAKPIQNTIVDESQELDTNSFTPLDFPDVDLTQEELDNLLSSLE